MYASALQFDQPEGRQRLDMDAIAAGIRARGTIDISSKARAGGSVRDMVREEGSLRIRFPREAGPGLHGVMVNTGGGMTGGDRFSISAKAGEGSCLTLTSAAAEKLYRSLSDIARLEVRLEAGPRSSLAWLPQEAIVHDGARIARNYDISIAGDASLLFCDMTCIGRPAMGETVTSLYLKDSWKIREKDALVFADGTRIDGNATNILSRAHTTGGATSFGTLVHAGSGALTSLEPLRTILAGSENVTAGAGIVNGVCVVRVVASGMAQLRRTMAGCIQHVLGHQLPRSWST